jgi:alcohol dehydrogenase class IV
VLIVTDAFMASSALMKQVRAALGTARVEVFDRVLPNPDIDTVTDGLRVFLDVAPDAIVALGGGSPIDTAKTVRKFALEQGHDLKCGFYVIPTTSGSGSEVTSFAVVTDPTDHAKHALSSVDMLPEVAIIDPEAVRTAPPKLTADAGMDATSHAVEAYVAYCASDFSDAMAEKALRLILANLPRTYRDGDDMEAREHQHNAATMAGIAFQNAGLGIVHGMSHAIGGSFHVAHGRLNGILLPHVIAYNAGELGFGPNGLTPVARRYAELARAVGLTATTERNQVLALIARVVRLREELDMPATVSAAGVDKAGYLAVVDDLAQTALADFCTLGNPVQPTIADLTRILKAVA